jgi:alpha-1,2-mannosyltransferase
VNQPREKLFEIFSKAKVAMHTMKHEHFGIAIVELMSSGIITVAHNSAGPKLDIIGGTKKRVGYLAEDLEDYSISVHNALTKFDNE